MPSLLDLLGVFLAGFGLGEGVCWRYGAIGLIDRIIDAHGDWGISAYNGLRLSFTILAPTFIVLGVAGFFCLGNLYINDKIVTGVGRTISDIFDIVLGLLLGYLRLTVFRHKRHYEETST